MQINWAEFTPIFVAHRGDAHWRGGLIADGGKRARDGRKWHSGRSSGLIRYKRLAAGVSGRGCGCCFRRVCLRLIYSRWRAAHCFMVRHFWLVWERQLVLVVHPDMVFVVCPVCLCGLWRRYVPLWLQL